MNTNIESLNDKDNIKTNQTTTKSSKGGKREGAGRKKGSRKTPLNTKQRSIYVTDQELLITRKFIKAYRASNYDLDKTFNLINNEQFI